MKFCAIVQNGSSGSWTSLEEIARACSPRVERYCDTDTRSGLIFDADGLARIFGTPDHIGHEVQRLAAERRVSVRVAVAGSATAAWLLAAHSRMPVTVAEPGRDAAALAAMPVDVLLSVRDLAPMADDVRRQRVARGRNFRAAPSPMRLHNTGYTQAHAQVLTTLARWGLRTLGDLAALPRAELRARFGALGVRMHEVALGLDRAPMVPGEPVRRFVERLALDWPIEGLEPLSFVLARLCESLSKQLEQADRGAVSITTRLALVSKKGFERTLHLPAPMRDARVLRTLVQLDLEGNPIEGRRQKAEGRNKGGNKDQNKDENKDQNKDQNKDGNKDGNKDESESGDTGIESGGIDAVELEVEVSPGRIAQGALFVRTLPTAESLATLVARLSALMGDVRVGAPELKDTNDEREIGLGRFEVRDVTRQLRGAAPAVQGAASVGRKDGSEERGVMALRRLRRPPAVRMASLEIVNKAGPWRSSGRWWRRDGATWDRDAWDMQLRSGQLIRVSRNRLTHNWELEGTYD